MSNDKNTRTLNFKIFKYNPSDKDATPKFRSYKLKEKDKMSIFMALNEIRETQDPSLQFDFVCRAGICGSCGMVINGKPKLGCKTLTSTLPSDITLLPLPVFKLIGDLSVDTGAWMMGMNKRVESWIHSKGESEKSFDEIEERMNPDLAYNIFELDRCIECGCCISACGTIRMRDNFIGAAGLNRVARFEVDTRDKRNAEDIYDILGDDNGIFGCMSLMGCEDHCPKELPLQTKIAYLRRKMVKLK